jgi:hypothetical protein
MATVLLIAVLAVLVFLNSTAPDGAQDTEHRYRIALLEAQGLRSGSTKGGTDMHRSSTGEKPTKNASTPEEIRKRAFEIHIERGGIHGCDLDDWLQAERELRERYNEGAHETPKRK